MPIVVFFQAPAAIPPHPIITPLSPFDGERNVSTNAKIIFGLNSSNGLDIDFSSLNMTLDGYAVITAGVVQGSFRYTLSLGKYNSSLGFVISVYKAGGFTNGENPVVHIDVNDSTGLHATSNNYSFLVNSASAFFGYSQFGGAPQGRYQILANTVSQSFSIGKYIDEATVVYGLRQTDIALLAKHVATKENISGYKLFKEDAEGSFISKEQYILEKFIDQPSKYPRSIEPLFASTVLSPMTKQIGAIKLQAAGVESAPDLFRYADRIVNSFEYSEGWSNTLPDNLIRPEVDFSSNINVLNDGFENSDNWP